MKRITVTLTEWQAQTITDDQEDRILNHEAWLKEHDDPKTEAKLAFRKRLLEEIKQELVKVRN